MLLNLNTWQRLMLRALVATTHGDLRKIRQGLKALDVLELTPEEREAVGLVDHPDGGSTWTEAGHRFELEFSDEAIELLRELVAAKDDWPMTRDVVDLCEQLGIEEPEQHES